jgi:hypothetical protein
MKNVTPPILFAPFRSVFLAIFLGLTLGPLGLIYSTVVGSVIMLFITLVLNLVDAYVHFPDGWMFVIWFVCVYWNVLATNAHNKQILTQYGVAVTEE